MEISILKFKKKKKKIIYLFIGFFFYFFKGIINKINLKI
jgi:hypothetical protein